MSENDSNIKQFCVDIFPIVMVTVGIIIMLILKQIYIG